MKHGTQAQVPKMYLEHFFTSYIFVSNFTNIKCETESPNLVLTERWPFIA